MKKQLKRATVFVFSFVVLFFIFGGVLSFYLRDSRNETLKEQVELETDEYKTRILKQLQSDFQTLSTISAFITSSSASDRESLAEQLNQAQENNDFVTIAYYDQNGSGIMSNHGQDQAITHANLSMLSPEGREGVQKALEGEPSVSRLFESTISGRRVFVYSIPVYQDNEVIGALSASDQIDIFSDILSGNTVLGGGGYIHMINSDGDFLIRSANTVVTDNPPTIFDGPYLSEKSKDEVSQALQHEDTFFSTFTYKGKSYPFMLEPVGLNNWYLFCVNTGEGLSADVSGITRIIRITFTAIMLLFVFLMLYGYRLLRNYSRDLLHLAYFDALTGAENMSRFRQRLAEALKHTSGSVTTLTIRQFPFLTEIYGQQKSDQLLRQIKKVAERHLNEGEFFCRDTEDRFYLFMKDNEPDLIRPRLNAFIHEIEQNSPLEHTDYQLAIYCGVTISSDRSDPAKEAERMLTQIHFALDKAKGGHSSTIWFFDTELHKQEELENYIESHMHYALQNGEFKVFLQPKMDLKNTRINSAEALVRWQTDSGKMIFPNQFIPLFEQNGFCASLDLYMIEQACCQIRCWIDHGIPPIPISVNQSKLLFFTENYVEQLRNLIEKYQIPARFIILEILEGMALENVDELNAKIAQLQQEGFRISLDDFGSGYSSLNTLGKLKIDELKLDRDFLMSAAGENQERVRLIMQEIVHMTGVLGISTVAEGVETPEDEQLIRSIGCDTGQGYLYSRPLSTADFDRKYMEKQRRNM